MGADGSGSAVCRATPCRRTGRSAPLGQCRGVPSRPMQRRPLVRDRLFRIMFSRRGLHGFHGDWDYCILPARGTKQSTCFDAAPTIGVLHGLASPPLAPRHRREDLAWRLRVETGSVFCSTTGRTRSRCRLLIFALPMIGRREPGPCAPGFRWKPSVHWLCKAQ